MRLSILLAALAGFLAYGLTLYFDRANRPGIAQAPEPANRTDYVPGRSAPAFSFTAVDGKTRALGEFRGKIVILNFWASWCAPCVKEFPVLLQFAEEHADDVVLIALSSDHDAAAMKRFLEKMPEMGLKTGAKNVFIARDELGEITGDLFQTFRLPETVVIDRNQTLRHKLVGAGWSEETLEDIISGL